jgi:hypothetical protein
MFNEHLLYKELIMEKNNLLETEILYIIYDLFENEMKWNNEQWKKKWEEDDEEIKKKTIWNW